MIPNVTRGGRTRGLLRYLVGPGHDEAQVHTHPHLVAGDEEAVLIWGGEPQLDVAAGDAIAAHLDVPRQRYGTRVTTLVKGEDGAPQLDEHGEVVRKDAHVWHCSLSLHPDEPALSDDEWREICEQFIERMGFQAAGCRWVAVRHGESAGGNDHVHLVVQLVGESGHAASVHLDRPRAQQCARELERQHGLRVVEGRERKRGARATNTRQTRRAASEHRAGEIPSAEPDRELLERAIRTLAAASQCEAEFVCRVRTHTLDGRGLVIRPRFAAGRDDVVVGYSVALSATTGKPLVAHAGGRLGKDLTLPRLRQAWADTPQTAGEAVAEWQRAWRREPPTAIPNPPAGQPDAGWEDAIAQLQNLRGALAAAPAGERGAWADVARQGAAIFHGWAALAPEHADALRHCGEELARSAQLPAGEARRARAMPQARNVAILCAALMAPSNQLLYWIVLAQQLAALTQAISDMHQAAGEAQRAAALATALREQLTPLRATLKNQRASADPAYAQAREAARLAQIAQPSRAGAAAQRPAQPAEGEPQQQGHEQPSDAAAEALRLARIATPDRSPLASPRKPPPEERSRGRPPTRPPTPRKGR